MFKIIPPEKFETTSWKNGKGETVQLAISTGGCIDGFDWRLSIASVIEDGMFSDFSGYDRNLILLQGDGIELTHNDTRNETRVDELKKPLSISNFSGSDRTIGRLFGGSIKDFNVMTKTGKYKVDIETYVEKQSVNLSSSTVCFIYSKNNASVIKTTCNEVLLRANHLMQIIDYNEESSVEGCELIVVYLKEV